MFERQAEGLEEIVGSVDVQLKEVYDEIERENKKNADELELLRVEHKALQSLLNSYGIPTKSKGRPLTLLERMDIALKMSA